MKEIRLENVEIGDFRLFSQGFGKQMLGAEYDDKTQVLKVFVEDDSIITKADVLSYLKSPKKKLVFSKSTLIDELKEHFGDKIAVLVESENQIELLVTPAEEANVGVFIKSRHPEFNQK